VSLSFLTHLECSKCGKYHKVDEIQTVCNVCGKPLFAQYDLDAAGELLTKQMFHRREASMWRYFELLPIRERRNVVSLGEGWTPLTVAPRLAEETKVTDILIKDEAIIPTGTFKARGLSAAISKAKELGVIRVALPSAGNAAGAISAYGARAGMEVFVFMPDDAPKVNAVESQIMNAKVVLVRGLISDAGRLVAEEADEMGWFVVSTLKEPYRVEGKKTMGFELAEQMGWDLPDVIIYPTGGGTGIIGMWKAFDEMERLGWIGSERPRMVSVQSEGCAPIPDAFEKGKDESEFWEGADTVAAGLRVPKALGDFLILKIIRESGGIALAVSDKEIMGAMEMMAKKEGIFPCPEGAATLAALTRLTQEGKVDHDEQVVLFNTGSGLKYTDLFEVNAITVDPDDEFDYRRLETL
jgi:threonine synthase